MDITNQIQTHTLNHLLHSEEYCRRVIPYLKKEYFEGAHKTVFDLIVSFVNKHNKLPTGKVLELELQKVNAHEEIINSAGQLIQELKTKSDLDLVLSLFFIKFSIFSSFLLLQQIIFPIYI